MGFLKDLGDSLTGGASGIIGGAMNLAGTLITGAQNRKAQEKENAKDRAFNSAEAEKQRNFEEQMYIAHESPIAQAQARAQAGLNPAEGVSSQSVGTGSTASAHSSALPAMQAPSFEFISQLPLLAQQIKQAKADTQIRQSEAEGQEVIRQQEREDLRAKQLANAREAFNNGHLEEWYNAQLAELNARAENERWSKKKKEAEVENLEYVNRMAKEFVEQGGNTYTDESNLKKSATAHNEALTALAEAKTETEREEAKRVISETYLNYVTASLRDVEQKLASKDLKAYEQRFLWEKEIHNQHYRLNKIAIAEGLSREKIAELDAAYEQAMHDLYVDDDGEATGYAKFVDFMKSAGNAVGIAVGSAIGLGGKAVARGASRSASKLPSNGFTY